MNEKDVDKLVHAIASDIRRTMFVSPERLSEIEEHGAHGYGASFRLKIGGVDVEIYVHEPDDARRARRMRETQALRDELEVEEYGTLSHAYGPDKLCGAIESHYGVCNLPEGHDDGGWHQEWREGGKVLWCEWRGDDRVARKSVAPVPPQPVQYDEWDKQPLPSIGGTQPPMPRPPEDRGKPR